MTLLPTSSQARSHPHEKFVVSAYTANLMICTPAWRRIGAQMYNDHQEAALVFAKNMQETTARRYVARVQHCVKSFLSPSVLVV
jgi:hypothetical protein